MRDDENASSSQKRGAHANACESRVARERDRERGIRKAKNVLNRLCDHLARSIPFRVARPDCSSRVRNTRTSESHNSSSLSLSLCLSVSGYYLSTMNRSLALARGYRKYPERSADLRRPSIVILRTRDGIPIIRVAKPTTPAAPRSERAIRRGRDTFGLTPARRHPAATGVEAAKKRIYTHISSD